jgi:hypothetical protein
MSLVHPGRVGENMSFSAAQITENLRPSLRWDEKTSRCRLQSEEANTPLFQPAR